jgi:ankyrin repeat protein
LAGANKDAVNTVGLNMVHVAAQGDSAATLYLFKELGVPISARDIKGSTPLHWACFSSSEIALCYLAAWNPDLNAKDYDGQTPLHLAIKSVEAIDSVRPVRFLVIRGADKTIKNNKNITPI